MKITVYNRGPEAATIHVLPHLWFRNFWKHNPRFSKPDIVSVSSNCLQTSLQPQRQLLSCIMRGGEQLFCENETNNQRMYNRANDSPFVKDGINNHVVNKQNSVNPEKARYQSRHLAAAKIQPGAAPAI